MFKQGDVLFSTLDYNTSMAAENWLVARGRTLTLKMKNCDFEGLWRKQQSLEKRKFIPLLRGNSLLSGLSDLRINLLWECMQLRVYEPGEMIAAQSKKSEYNFAFRRFFELKTKKRKQIRKKVIKDGDESEEREKSMFEQALALFAPKANIKSLTLEMINRKNSGIKMVPINSPFNKSRPKIKPTYNTPWEGVFIVLRGKWEIINRKSPKSHDPEHPNYNKPYSVGYLFSGDYFGESEVFPVHDFTYYGDIYAVKEVEVVFLPYEIVKRGIVAILWWFSHSF